MSLFFNVLLYLQRVKLHFTSFDIPDSSGDHCDRETVYIYDGSDATAPRIHYICSPKFLVETITSSGNTIFVDFKSDDRYRRRGFEIQYSSIEGKTDCYNKSM